MSKTTIVTVTFDLPITTPDEPEIQPLELAKMGVEGANFPQFNPDLNQIGRPVIRGIAERE